MKRTAFALLLLASLGAQAADEGLVASKTMTPETALKAAQAAMASCRKAGYQIGVSVVDRSGLTIVTLRDRFAGAHTIDMSVGKAWSSASFRISTGQLATETQSGRPMSGIRQHPRVIAAGGGLPIEGGGAVVGAIGVSGAPSGEADEACANAGIAAIRDLLEF
jgi:uncharacterized protein GlcG (DUF336 family)